MTAELRIGGTEREFVLISVLRYEHPELTDHWDGNWVVARIEIQVGAWKGEYTATLRTKDFVSFHQQVEALSAGQTREACFETLEAQLSLTLKSDALRHVVVKGEVVTGLAL